MRFATFGKYLTTLSISFTGPAKPPALNNQRREPSSKRKRLHLLYLINDLLHHATTHINDTSIVGKVQPILVDLFTNAASFRHCPKYIRKVLDLIDLWEERNYYSTGYTDKLREAVRTAPDAQNEATGSLDHNDEADIGTKTPKNIPYAVPASHGDAGTPWYDLPAGNFMPHIIPNSTRPINPNLVKPLRFVTGPADANLASAVKDLLQDVAMIYGVTEDEGSQEDSMWDIDELGLPILRDIVSGEVLKGEGYYGWSKDFCEKMRRRRRAIEDPPEHHRDGRRRSTSSRQSRSRSRSSSWASPGLRKRRYSGSDTPGSRSRSRCRSRAERPYSQPCSPCGDRTKPLSGDWRSRIPQQSTSRSNSPQRSSRDTRGTSPNPQHGSRRWSPGPGGVDLYDSSSWGTPSDGREDFQNNAPLPSFPGGIHPPGSGVVPVSPPPPLNFQRQWPPPPPPPMPYGHQPQQGGAWPLPPPPPQYLQGTQSWQPLPYEQFPPGLGASRTAPSQHGSGRGYENRGQGAPSASQQQYQGREIGYGSRGGSRGRGWS